MSTETHEVEGDNVQALDVEALEHDFRRVFSVLRRVQRRFGL